LCTGGGMPWQEASKSAFAAWGGGVFEIATGRGALQAAGFAMVGVTVPSKVHHASMAYSDPTLAVHF